MLTVGTVVIATAGKEKNSLLVVVKIDNNKVYLCDGKNRPLEKAKVKNIKHIKLTKMVLTKEQMATNRKLRKSLNELKTKKNATFDAQGGKCIVQGG